MGITTVTVKMKVSIFFASFLLTILLVELRPAEAAKSLEDLFRGCDWCKKKANQDCGKILQFEKRLCSERCKIETEDNFLKDKCRNQRRDDVYCKRCKVKEGNGRCVRSLVRVLKCIKFCEALVKQC